MRDTCVLTGAAAAKPDSPYSTEGRWLGAQPGVLAEATEPHSFCRGSGSCSVQMSQGLEKAQRESEGPGKAGGVRLGLPGVCPHGHLVTWCEAVGP